MSDAIAKIHDRYRDYYYVPPSELSRECRSHLLSAINETDCRGWDNALLVRNDTSKGMPSYPWRTRIDGVLVVGIM